MRSDGFGRFRKRVGETAGFYTLTQHGNSRKLWSKPAIHEHKLTGKAGCRKTFQIFCADAGLASQGKRGLGQRAEIGEPPLFVMRGGNACVGKLREGIFAQV